MTRYHDARYDGTWPITQAATIPGKAYTGSLTISPDQVDGHRLRWKTSGGDYTGIGLVIDGRLWVAFGEGEAYGLCIYAPGDGVLNGTFTAPSYRGATGWERVQALDHFPDEERIYNIEGCQPTQVAYSGQIALKPHGELYLMRWVFANATGSWVGVGMMRHGLLVTAYGAQADYSWGCGCYALQPDGSLQGDWAIPAYPQPGMEVFGTRR